MKNGSQLFVSSLANSVIFVSIFYTFIKNKK